MTRSLLLFALVAGTALPIQAGINALLTRRLGHPVQAAFVSFVIGSFALLAYCLAMRLRWPGLSEMRQVPPWLWVGGLLGAFYVAATVVLAPKLGASTMIGLIIAGQMAASLALDHFGMIGFAPHPASVWRLLGAALLVVGVVIIQRT
ncbi:MAG: DMT family transporter [Singulisphaera sp.]